MAITTTESTTECTTGVDDCHCDGEPQYCPPVSRMNRDARLKHASSVIADVMQTDTKIDLLIIEKARTVTKLSELRDRFTDATTLEDRDHALMQMQEHIEVVHTSARELADDLERISEDVYDVESALIGDNDGND